MSIILEVWDSHKHYSLTKKDSFFFGHQQLSFQIAFWTLFLLPVKLKE